MPSKTVCCFIWHLSFKKEICVEYYFKSGKNIRHAFVLKA